MSPFHEPQRSLAEEWLASAARLPTTTDTFRARVLHESYRAQQHSVSLQRIQTLTTSLLAATLLLCLPGYYHSLRDPEPTTRTSSAARALESRPHLGTSSDSYEWGLVESALAFRDSSARQLLGTL